jgi:ribose 5-phosphate isomerase RpiB
VRSLICTSVGVSIFANKFSSIYFVTCDSVEDAQNIELINNSNIRGIHGIPEEGKKILDA